MTSKNTSKTLKLYPRLAKIAELLPRHQSLADIGTDHAYIPIYALLEGKAAHTIASDINQGPLMRAKANAERCGVSDKVSLRLGAGLTTLEPGDAETIVIAGMGGILIADILENSKAVVRSAKYLILQPMTAVRELREYLCSHDFTVEKEVLCAEEDKIYNIICVKTGGKTDYSPKEMLLGRGLAKASPTLYKRYYAAVERKLKIRLEGLKSSASSENRHLADNVQKELELIQEV